MSKAIFYFILLLVSTKVSASTFIGNGGNVNDVELRVTLKQIETTLEQSDSIKKMKEKNKVCACASGYEDHPLCELIKSMNHDQVQFCENFVIEQMEDLKLALRNANFEWSNEELQVQESGQIRSADAVTIPEKMKIYLRQEGFNSLTPMKRMFLVTHELFHLIKYNKKTIQDDEPVGPFTGEKGGRNLLNSAAAGLTMISVEKNIFQKQTGYLTISKYIQHHWISLLTPTVDIESDQKTSYKLKPRGPRFSYRYQFSQEDGFGISLQTEPTEQSETVLGTIKIKERRSINGFGINYRWLLFKKRDALSFMRNSHFLFEFLVENISGEYALYEDPFISERYTANHTGPSLKVHYLYPFKNDFWVNLGFSADDHKLIYENLNLKYNKNTNYHFFAGVSYGF